MTTERRAGTRSQPKAHFDPPTAPSTQLSSAYRRSKTEGRTRPDEIYEMSPPGPTDSALAILSAGQQRAWRAYMRVVLRLTYEMNRQLQSGSRLSLPDYDVLIALRYASGGRMRLSALAAKIGWERSRLSHHARRLETRGLAKCCPAVEDRRSTEVTLTASGREQVMDASRAHIDLVRRMFFDGLPEGLVDPLTNGLESVYANMIDRGTLPGPANES